MKTNLQISVRALVEYVLRTGDLEPAFSGSTNPVDAIRAHQKIQKSRGFEYTPEVTISHRVETEKFLLDIQGRIDGIFIYPDRVVIDEIKTTTRDLDSVVQDENRLHWGQVQSYAFLYAVRNDLAEIEAQLTYFRLETGEMREIRRSFRREELENFFQSLVTRYLAWAEKISEWRRVRDESLQALEFPFPAYRAGQRAMAAAVYTTIRKRGQLLIQAPTGIGKTMAALFPAVKTLRDGLASKIFYLTARTTGKTVAESSLMVMRDHGLKLKSLNLTAKEKICFCPRSACSGEECEYARGYYDRIHEALEEAFRQDAFPREVIEEIAEKHRVCPFEFSLDLSLWMDCIICDYNYVFDPRVYLKRFFLEEDGDYVFLVDEAHNLVDRARDMFSAEIRKQPFLELRRMVKNQFPEIYPVLGRINTWMVGARKRCEESNPFAEKEPPDTLFPLLRKFLSLTERWLVLNRKTVFRKELLELYFTVHGFIRMAERYDDSYVSWYEKKGDDVTVKLFCLDPARHLKETLERGSAAIFFSATLTPADYFRRIFGCGESARELILSSPFPPENLCLLISGGISTFYKHREQTKDAVTRAILSLVRQKGGNYLLFFPSYEYLMLVYEQFTSASPETKTILQTPGMAEPERDRFIARFSQDSGETLAGFAVMGGVFGESIDLVGDRLTGAVIVGVGLPAICLERELIRDYFASRSGEGFEFAYLYPGFNKVLQAAGRVIRTESDRGAVLLIDTRFTTGRYRSLFPKEWQPILMRNEAQFDRILQRFWNG
ncbi:MAG: ATP-dependent DNA helicase [Candidatus Latescibacter sp.]|nr:ATP-dependent DNA helicase [Candidatus Latescibacter sp.]